MHPHTVLHFAVAQVVQVFAPLAILLQIVGDTFREQNVAGVATVHDSLRHVDAGAGDIRPLADIDDTTHRSAVDSHPHLQIRMILEGFTNLQRTDDGRIRRAGKDKSHAIASRQRGQLTGSVGVAESISCSHDLIEGVQVIALLINQQLGVTDNIDEQNMRDLQTERRFHGFTHQCFSLPKACSFTRAN